MSVNADKIIEQYDLKKEDGRNSLSRSAGLEFYYTKKHLQGLIKKSDRILEIGCATGYYGFYYADKCREYLGIDIVPAHIQRFQQRIAERRLQNVSCRLGDATALQDIEDGSFDIVLCLGPMYHLPPAGRELAFAECARVCRKGGIAAFAYINKIGVYAGACILDSRYPTELANRCVLENGTDDIRPDIFFYTTPEQMNAQAQGCGFHKIKNLGTDFFLLMDVVNGMDDARFETLRPLYDQMAGSESCTGLSNHALLVCRKE
ncbi:MAG: class I SAM-dependent methyltransferase [Provencibacterium sp.]|nr:class I SAM-dependent methyltransferase [Provencibacterium sp.]